MRPLHGGDDVSGHADRLASLYTMFEQFEEDVLGIVTPKTKTVQRFLFTD